MSTKVGLWIDHRKAIVVAITEKNNLGGHIIDIETVDKMTNPQIAAKVRQYFAKEHSPTN